MGRISKLLQHAFLLHAHAKHFRVVIVRSIPADEELKVIQHWTHRFINRGEACLLLPKRADECEEIADHLFRFFIGLTARSRAPTEFVCDLSDHHTIQRSEPRCNRSNGALDIVLLADFEKNEHFLDATHYVSRSGYEIGIGERKQRSSLRIEHWIAIHVASQCVWRPKWKISFFNYARKGVAPQYHTVKRCYDDICGHPCPSLVCPAANPVETADHREGTMPSATDATCAKRLSPMSILVHTCPAPPLGVQTSSRIIRGTLSDG